MTLSERNVAIRDGGSRRQTTAQVSVGVVLLTLAIGLCGLWFGNLFTLVLVIPADQLLCKRYVAPVALFDAAKHSRDDTCKQVQLLPQTSDVGQSGKSIVHPKEPLFDREVSVLKLSENTPHVETSRNSAWATQLFLRRDVGRELSVTGTHNLVKIRDRVLPISVLFKAQESFKATRFFVYCFLSFAPENLILVAFPGWASRVQKELKRWNGAAFANLSPHPQIPGIRKQQTICQESSEIKDLINVQQSIDEQFPEDLDCAAQLLARKLVWTSDNDTGGILKQQKSLSRKKLLIILKAKRRFCLKKPSRPTQSTQIAAQKTQLQGPISVNYSTEDEFVMELESTMRLLEEFPVCKNEKPKGTFLTATVCKREGDHEDFAVHGISKLEYRSPSVGSDTCLTPTQTPLGKRIRSSSVAATTTATPQSVAMALLSMSFKPAASPAAGGNTPEATSTPMILDNSMGENYVLVDDSAADPSSPEAAPSAAAPDPEDAIAALLQLQFGFPSGPPTVLAPNPVSSQSEDKASRKI
ncbi:hypothetical protein HDU82_002557, partial [Entophlyctis luteolus]